MNFHHDRDAALENSVDMVSMILVCDSFCEILTAQSPGLTQPAGYDARFRKSAASDGMLTEQAAHRVMRKVVSRAAVSTATSRAEVLTAQGIVAFFGISLFFSRASDCAGSRPDLGGNLKSENSLCG